MPGVALAEARPPLVLVIDVGSSSVRVALHDGAARAVEGCGARVEQPLHVTGDGGVEADPGELIAALSSLVDRVLQAGGKELPSIGAVGMASYASSLLGVDGEARPLTPIYSYADTRPAADVRELRAQVDDQAVHQRTGCRLHTSYLPARLVWLRRTQPETFRRVRRWLSLPEYVYTVLLGRSSVSPSIASWSGLLDRRTQQWDREWLTLLDLSPDTLSAVGEEPLRGLASGYADRWPALDGVPWFPAVADGAAGNAGSGCTGPDAMALSLGTSGAVRVAMESAPATLPAGLWCYRLDGRRALVGGAVNDAGGAVAWAREALALPDFEEAERRIAEAEPDGHGLTVLPFLTGERSPGWLPGIRAAIAGIDRATTAEHLLQAVMEGVAYRLGLIVRELGTVAPDAGRVIASGGGAVHSPVWLQVMADVLDRPVTLCAEPEATSRGVAVLVLERLGVPPPLPPDRGPTFTPSGARHARHAAAMERQQRLYELLADWEG